MRTENEIVDRLRALLAKELDHRVKEACMRRPWLCIHNHQHFLDDRNVVEGEPNDGYNRITSAPGQLVNRSIGLCMYGSEHSEEWPGNICEDAIDAQRCPMFQPTTTKAQILLKFTEQLNTPGWVDENMPGVAELAWVLGETTAVKLPWWTRFWYHYILRIRVESPRSSGNILDLLPKSMPELPPAVEGKNEGVSA